MNGRIVNFDRLMAAHTIWWFIVEDLTLFILAGISSMMRDLTVT